MGMHDEFMMLGGQAGIAHEAAKRQAQEERLVRTACEAAAEAAAREAEQERLAVERLYRLRGSW